MTVSLVHETHSTTEDNEAGIATGWLPGRLSQAGRIQAASLGLRRRHDGLAAVFVPDLARAMEAATIAFSEQRLPLRQDRRLRGCNCGALNGCPVERLAAMRTHHIELPFNGGQGYRQAVEATASFLKDLKDQFDGQRVLVMVNSANRWALEHLLNGASLKESVQAPLKWQPGWTYIVP